MLTMSEPKLHICRTTPSSLLRFLNSSSRSVVRRRFEDQRANVYNFNFTIIRDAVMLARVGSATIWSSFSSLVGLVWSTARNGKAWPVEGRVLRDSSVCGGVGNSKKAEPVRVGVLDFVCFNGRDGSNERHTLEYPKDLHLRCFEQSPG